MVQPDTASAARPPRAGAYGDLLVDPRPTSGRAWSASRTGSSSLRQPAGRPLVEVVVAVDEAGRGEAAAAVDAPRRPRAARAARPPPSAAMPAAVGEDPCPSACSVPAASTVAIAQPSIRSASLIPAPRAAPRRAAPRRGSSRSRCSGRGCRPAPRGSRRRRAPGRARSRSSVATIRPGRAEAALHGAGLDERLLHRAAASSAGREALDGHHLAALAPGRPATRQLHTRHVVEVHRARAALALLAGVLRAGQAEPLAQHVAAGSRPPRRRRPRGPRR